MSNGVSIAGLRPPSTTVDWLKVVLTVTVGGLIYYAYCVQRMEGPANSPYTWLVGHWRSVSNYSHGPLIPFIASLLMWWNLSKLTQATSADWKPYWIAFGCSVGVLLLPELVNHVRTAWYSQAYRTAVSIAPILFAWQVWAVRGQLGALRQPPTSVGIALVLLATMIYYAGIKAAQTHSVIISFVLLLYGLALTLGGRRIFQMLFLPITFLFLMVPLNFLDEMVGFPLRMMVAKAATATLNWLGIPTIRAGTGIYSSVFRFDVADPCSGIRSLMALTTVTAAYAYVTQHAQWKRWVLFLSAMPLAVLGNMARVVTIALVAQVYGQEVATKAYHDYSGYIVFGVALSAMVIFGLLLNFPYRRVWQSWMQPVPRKETLE